MVYVMGLGEGVIAEADDGGMSRNADPRCTMPPSEPSLFCPDFRR